MTPRQTTNPAEAEALVRDLFRKRFGVTPPHLVRAPGRLEVLGNHTDYNEGLVMAAAVDRFIFLAAEPRTDGRVELVSTAFPEPERFRVDELRSNPAARWADYVKGVLAQLRRRGAPFGGFNAVIHGTVPAGAGMSSSAALEVATALAVRRMYPFSLSDTGLAAPPQRDARGGLPTLTPGERMHLARLCRAAENEFVGMPCGILDQVSSLFGRAWRVLTIDCRFLTVETLPLTGEALVVCDSGVRHALVAGQYAELRHNCESAARKLGAQALRSVELADLKAQRGRLSEREFECAYHVVSEIARVVAAERALREGDHAQFGQYLFQSHESSRDFLRNSTAELDLLVELARAHPACLGARLTGGGFGGATINLVRHHEVEDFVEYMAREHERRTGRGLRPQVCQIVDGAE
ncbi:MAG: galactokinase family protein [Verrucomicrobiales bacterium]|nr:galactokinase family protein [Verrucomicrobiales bacterium]